MLVQVDHVSPLVQWEKLEDCPETAGVALVGLPTCTTAKSLRVEQEVRWLQRVLDLQQKQQQDDALDLPPLPEFAGASCVGEPDEALHALRGASRKDEHWVRRCETLFEEKVRAMHECVLEFDGIVLKCGGGFLLFPEALAVRQIMSVEGAQSFSQQHHVCTQHAETCDVLGKLRTHTVVQGDTATMVSVRRCVLEALHRATGCPQLVVHAAKDVPAPHIVTGKYALPADPSLLLRAYRESPRPERVQWSASLQLTPQDLRAQLGEDVDVRFTQRAGEPATLRIHRGEGDSGLVTRSDRPEATDSLEGITREFLAQNIRFPGLHVYPGTLTLHCEGQRHMTVRIEKDQDAPPRVLHLASSAVEPFLASSAALVPGYTVLDPPQIAPVEFQVDGQEKTYTLVFPSGGVLAPLVERTLLDELGVKMLVTLHEKGAQPCIDMVLLSNHVLHVRQKGEDPLVIRAQTTEEREQESLRICAVPYWMPIPQGHRPHEASLVAKPGKVLTGPFFRAQGDAVQPWYADLLRDAHFLVHTYEDPDGQRVLVAAEQTWLQGISACLEAKFGKTEITVHEANEHTLKCAKTQIPEAYWSSQGGSPVKAQTTEIEMISKLRIKVIRRVLSPLATVTLDGNHMKVECKFREPEAMTQLQDMLRMCQDIPEDKLQNMLDDMPASLA